MLHLHLHPQRSLAWRPQLASYTAGVWSPVELCQRSKKDLCSRTAAGEEEATMGEPSTGPRRTTWFQKTELVVNGILLGFWSPVSTVINTKMFIDEGYPWAAALSLFFLYLPGLLTSVAFFVLNRRCHWTRELSSKRVLLYSAILLLCHPVVPVAACVYVLIKRGRHREIAVLLRLLNGFLGDGPQFVLRFVAVVLYGNELGSPKYSIVFILSMVSSFSTLVLFGLRFNERKTNNWTKCLVSLPMFVATLAARASILAVLIKETIQSQDSSPVDQFFKLNQEWIWGPAVIMLYILINICTFWICGQDLARSVLFGISSTLVPAGYNNDEFFYQRPFQPITNPETDGIEVAEAADVQELDILNGTAQQPAVATSVSRKMRSSLFLILHTVTSTVLLTSCAVYIYMTRWGPEIVARNILMLPQLLAVVPGCLFVLARSIMMLEEPPFGLKFWTCLNRPESVCNCLRISMGVLVTIVAYASLIPALYVSYIWVLLSLVYRLFIKFMSQ